jgi:hypothetical protein
MTLNFRFLQRYGRKNPEISGYGCVSVGQLDLFVVWFGFGFCVGQLRVV